MTSISIAQVSVSIVLIVSILLQQKGSGLGGAFGGGSGGFSGTYHTRRGFEKFLTSFSIALTILFIVLAIANVWIA